MRVLHITTVPMSLTFLRGQVGFMKARGIEVHALSSPGPDLDSFGADEAVQIHAVSMTRRITPLLDLVALIRISRSIRRIQPTIVHAHTPKGGLLGMLAASLSGTRLRIYQMRGLPLLTASGVRKFLLRLSERISCRLAHTVICNSHSMRRVAIEEGICPPDKIEVLGGGSGNGVDSAARFNPDRLPPNARQENRARLGIPEGAPVIGFVGRMVKEKGIRELQKSWDELREEYPEAHLLLVGPFESQDPLPLQTVDALQADERVHLVGLDWDTPPLYATMDIVTLPSYREGFPNVPLESAAMGLPVVATAIPGCMDAVKEGETGLLVPPRDAAALSKAFRAYLNAPELRRRHGEAGRERVLREFQQDRIWRLLYQEYLKARTIPAGLRAKRAFDVLASLTALVACAPVLAIISLVVGMRLRGPILFLQERPGRNGQPFMLVKFRTMVDIYDEKGELLPDGDRLTPLGEWLRRTSLDELPELWNVLKGDMSLVGPRPLLMDYLPLYTPAQARRHEVSPGITGWAQVNGRNATSWERRLELDAWYVDNRSFSVDLKILMLTIRRVLLREGINQQGVATMERFRGTAL